MHVPGGGGEGELPTGSDGPTPALRGARGLLAACADEQPWRGGDRGTSPLGQPVSGAERPPMPSEGQRLGPLSLVKIH